MRTDVSEGRIANFFRKENQQSKKSACRRGLGIIAYEMYHFTIKELTTPHTNIAAE
jgi:hypothetical protein